MFCQKRRTQVTHDPGSGMSSRNKGLNQWLELSMKRQIQRLVPSHKDRLPGFGAELVFLSVRYKVLPLSS
ncbi:MAG: hypothetical protein OXC07_06655 [Kistimonas sp.]|nr:hypothetical protein [Kistimonas sp.]